MAYIEPPKAESGAAEAGSPAPRAESPTPRAESPAPRSGSATPRSQSPARVDGGLVVESRPAGARVTVNGIGYGETPLRIGYLPFGTKRIRLIKEGYTSVERTVRIDAGSPRPRVQIALRRP